MNSEYMATSNSLSEEIPAKLSSLVCCNYTFKNFVVEMALDGKTALVTGFAGAIGSTIAKTLANAGCDVIGIDRVKQKIAQKSIDEIKAGNRQDIIYFECDLLKKEDVKKVSLEIKPTCKVDIIVNVAGRLTVDKVEDMTAEDWDEDIGINLTAPFLVIKQFLGSMKEKGWGRIINISSTCGLVARPSMSSYVASKTGLVGLTRAVALESAEFGVTCNAICPSTVDTPLVTKMIKDFQKTSTKSFDEIKEEYLQCLPTKRFTEASQIADLVVFLCSPAGNNITGTAIPVDGGYTTS